MEGFRKLLQPVLKSLGEMLGQNLRPIIQFLSVNVLKYDFLQTISSLMFHVHSQKEVYVVSITNPNDVCDVVRCGVDAAGLDTATAAFGWVGHVLKSLQMRRQRENLHKMVVTERCLSMSKSDVLAVIVNVLVQLLTTFKIYV